MVDTPSSAGAKSELQGAIELVAKLVTAAVVMFVGVAASFDVLFRKPLVTLRSQ